MSRRKPTRSRAGSVLIEFSLVFVVFMMMLIALVEIGRGVWIFTTLNHAVLAGVRFATVHGSGNQVLSNGTDTTATAIQDMVRANAIGLTSEGILVVTAYDPNADRGSRFTVTATYGMPLMTSMFFSGDALELRVQGSGVILR